MWIVLILIILVAVIIGIFNIFIKRRMLVREAWSGIDVQLKRRHDLIPNIVEAVKGYMQYERGVLERVTQLRSSAEAASGEKDKAALENDITKAIKTILALAEAYPELKANEQFLALQKNLVEVEDEIQLARRYYNATVRDYNIAVETFPNVLFAALFNFPKKYFFEIETATERNASEVKF